MRTDFLESVKETTGVSAVNTIVDRTLNKALQDMHQERWPWQERRATIRTIPPYTTGTVAVAITSLTTRRTVTGTSTAWATANSFGDTNAAAARKMTLGAEPNVHLIATVDSATQITLETATPYSGDAALSGSGYAIYQDEYALEADFDDVLDARFFDEDRKISLIGAQELYRLYSRNHNRASPKVATIIELGPSGSVSLRKRVLFGPAADQTYLIPYRYWTTNLAVSSTGTGAANLTAAADQPIVPLKFRQAIVWKALEIWFSTRQKDATLAQDFGGRYTTLMLRARMDRGPTQDRPRLIPATATAHLAARRPYAPRTRRLVTGSRWDQMAE